MARAESCCILSLICLAFFVFSCTSTKNDCLPELTNKKECELKRSYDFIIIGAGGAGAVVANRLSEVANWDILLLEAGGEENFQSRFPYLPILLENTAVDWNYTTTKQKYACQSTGGYCKYPRGRVLGGSSSINYMVYMRGLQEDYNQWEADGNAGWSFEEVLPYFQKAENYLPLTLKSSLGKGGYLPVNENEPFWFTNTISSTLKELGIPEKDLNEGLGSGFMPMQVTIEKGERYSTARAYLDPIKDRINLDISHSSLVTKIIFNGTTAVGVQFEKDGHSYQAMAKKEVILSAGSINSPQILMLSGVGPADHLHSLGIPIIKNLPVGLNMHDHVGIFLTFKMQNMNYSVDFLSSLSQYLTNSTGILSFPLGGLVVALKNTSRSTMDYPDVQYHIGLTGNADTFYASGYFNHAESVGSVSLRSSSPHDPPLIDPKYLSTSRDMAALREVVEFTFKMASTNPLADYGLTFLSDCDDSNDIIGCLCRRYSQTFFHPVGTCKMGPQSDPSAVVDPELKVRHLQGLRIIDASIIPQTTSSNTLAPTVMIAEKAADLIKKEHF